MIYLFSKLNIADIIKYLDYSGKYNKNLYKLDFEITTTKLPNNILHSMRSYWWGNI